MGGLQSKYIQKRCAHVRHHGLLHTMLQAAQLAAQSVTTARWALSCSDMLFIDSHCEVMSPQAHRVLKAHASCIYVKPEGESGWLVYGAVQESILGRAYRMTTQRPLNT